MNDLRRALLYFNENIPNWLGWKRVDENGNKIPHEDRYQYKYILILDEKATLPTEDQINAKIQELKNIKYVFCEKDKLARFDSENLLFKNINQKEDIYMLKETGHFPFYEDPDQLEKILMNILKVN